LANNKTRGGEEVAFSEPSFATLQKKKLPRRGLKLVRKGEKTGFIWIGK